MNYNPFTDSKMILLFANTYLSILKQVLNRDIVEQFLAGLGRLHDVLLYFTMIAALRIDAAILLFLVPTHNELCEVKLYLASIF